MRVYELAKELNISSKDVADILDTADKKYKNVSGLTDDEVSKVRKKLAGGEKAEPEKPVKKPENVAANVNNGSNNANRDNRNGNGSGNNGGNNSNANRDNRNGNGNNNNNGEKREEHRKVSQVFFPQNSAKNDRNNRDRNDNRGGNGGNRDNRDNRGGNNGGNNGGRFDRDNRGGNGNGGNRDNNGRFDNRDNRNGNNGGRFDRDNRGGNGNGGNRDNNGRFDNRDNRNGNGNGNNGGRFDRDRNGNGGNGFNRGDRPNGGNGGNRDNRDNRGGNRPNNGGNGFNRGDRPNGGNGQNRRDDRRNDREKGGAREEFVFEAKPDSRRTDWGKDNHKNDRKKDVENKENIKFANSQKKPLRKEEKEEETIKQLTLPDNLTIKELADKMKVQPSVVVKKLFMQGKVVTINQEIDYDTAEEIALEFNCICEHEVKVDVIAELLKEDEEPAELLVPRPPVVCVMGHVDHGKTSLLDAIRETHVTAKESGGITQKIGAYTVDVHGQSITFLDTPGHEAFTAMRMRGAQATDIAILVVAADDGVMPQTIEAINHAKAAEVEIIVAINKIDKPNANIEKVKQELTEYGLISEDWGGSTTFVPVSAHTKEGIDELLEMILLTAEVNELKANPNRKARGIVIEAELDKGRGPVATILVQKGTLRVGDNVAAGASHGKIRAMIDDKGRRLKEAGPSTPVEILGLSDVPNAGEIIMAMDSDKEARNVAETFISEGKKKLLDDTKHKVSLDDIFEQIQAGNVKELCLIIKADVQGSVEAVKQSLVKLSNDEVVVKVIHGGVGNINESDVTLASASNAIIIGFNVKPDNQARMVADREKVDLRLYTVIYNAIEDVEAALKGMLEPIYEEQIIGHAEIRQIFKASGVGNIAGCIVTEGRITRDSKLRISRDGAQIHEAPIATLKHFKDEVKEVKAGTECGIVVEGFNDIQEGDIFEAYIMVEVPR
jgi:translation initiation factor IF-2